MYKELKDEVKNLLAGRGMEYEDFGTYTADSCHYPIFGARAAQAVADGKCDLGIVICGTGIGMSMVANKIKGIRCALCSDTYSAKMTRVHNNSNVLAIGAALSAREGTGPKTLLRKLVEDDDYRNTLGANARATVDRHRGAIARTLDIIGNLK